ncbi:MULTISPECIES: antibiotic biosynthesis monooxygenase [unclassified Streptomyces]|uniref:antibiotic biosynthesis monooxygenase n=1 Tax=unclassified Streptomyces TaxID=2593676 RepID=UPI0040436517
MAAEPDKEDGCRLYQLWRNKAWPYGYALIEHWQSQEHLTAPARRRTGSTSDDAINSYLKSNDDEQHCEEIPR